jgi:hypothetical protein
MIVNGATLGELILNLRQTAEDLECREPVATKKPAAKKAAKKATGGKKRGRKPKAKPAEVDLSLEEEESTSNAVEPANKSILDDFDVEREATEKEDAGLLGEEEKPKAVETVDPEKVKEAARGLIKLAKDRKKDAPAVLASVLREFNNKDGSGKAEALIDLDPAEYAGFVAKVAELQRKFS